VVEKVDLGTFKKLSVALHRRVFNRDLRLKSESELYERVRNAFDTVSKQLPHYSMFYILTRESDAFKYEEREINGRKVYLIGERHGTITPVDFVHENLVLKIADNPKRWLILLETVSMTSDLLAPSLFYLRKLAKLFNIPCEEVLVKLLEPDTINYVKSYVKKVNPSLAADEQKLDAIILSNECIGLQGAVQILIDLVKEGRLTLEEAKKEIEKLTYSGISHISRRSGMPATYVGSLMTRFLETPYEEVARQSEEFVLKPWNELTRERFYKLLEKYSDKSEILVNVGIAHLPAFL
jgi:hypothetical protein